MKNINVKERIAAIRKSMAYGLNPAEEAIVQLIGDLAGVDDQEPDLTKDMPKEVAAEDPDEDED